MDRQAKREQAMREMLVRFGSRWTFVMQVLFVWVLGETVHREREGVGEVGGGRDGGREGRERERERFRERKRDLEKERERERGRERHKERERERCSPITAGRCPL